MKKVLYLIIVLTLAFGAVQAQTGSPKPIVIKASYFDISPPLRDMEQRSDSKVDLSWKEGVVKNKLNVYSNDKDAPDPTFVDPVRQQTFGQVNTDTTIQNFDGTGQNGSWPPDTDGDVGLSRYFQVVNTKYAIYDKAGNKLVGPSSNSVIFTGLPHNTNDGDAIVLYDEQADRWLFSQFALPNYPNGPFYENVAISQTNDPGGTWYRYQFTFPNMPDYPKLSVWQDAYYMTVRMFASGTGNWIGPSVVAMDRTKMLAGDVSASMIMFSFPTSAEGTLSAHCNGAFPPAGTPCPCVYLTSSSVKIYDFHADFTTPANSTFTNSSTVTISPFAIFGNGSNSIPQKGTSVKLDAFSRRGCMFRMPFRKFNDHWSLLITTTVNLSSVGGIRWMELRNVAGSWSLYQEGTYSPDANSRWMQSIAMDTLGNIALGFSISSSNLFPSIRYTGRMNGDPLGVMTIAERGIMNGGGSQTSSDGRWGDYSSMVPDPVEIGKFWYTQEYYSSTSTSNWKTRIASFSFSNVFTTVATAVPNPLCAGDTSQLSVLPNGGSGTYTYAWSSIPAGFTSAIQSPKVAPLANTKYVVATSDGSITRHDTIVLNVGNKPVVFAGADTTVCWYLTSVNLHGSVQNSTQYGWSTSGSGSFTSSLALETAYLPSLNDKFSGSVDLKLTAGSAAPCSGNMNSIKHLTFDVCTGLDGQTSNEPGIVIQPNPAHGSVLIAISGINGQQANLTITSMEGKVLFAGAVEASAKPVLKSMDISGYAKGVYFVQLKTGQKVKTEKMVVQ